MLTANFTSWIAATLRSGTASAKNKRGETANIGASVMASSYGIRAAMIKASATTISGSVSTYGVFFGNGTTPPTVHDYTLESQITSAISVTNPSATNVSETDDYWELTATYGVFSGIGASISEIGLFINDGNSSTKAFLIDRTVLETPIVIPAGQSKQVTYAIRLNKPK